MRIGIFFGGNSREREISFAGGRTVFDNLDKTLFEPVPVFLDSIGNAWLLRWECLYKGTIRDFFPPAAFQPADFQIYAESLDSLSPTDLQKIALETGRKTDPSEWPALMDFAFLALHGKNGEDGAIQGLLQMLGIPFSGSGILGSAIGMNKAFQKEMMHSAGWPVKPFVSFRLESWSQPENRKAIFENALVTCGSKIVLRPANQGSSIGVSFLENPDFETFCKKTEAAFFIQKILKADWQKLSSEEKKNLVRELSDIRHGLGLPVFLNEKLICQPAELLRALDSWFESENSTAHLKAADQDWEVIAETFIEGLEFSCIVVKDENGKPFALPPTGIIKGKEVFDYRAKYLAGISRKETPIHLPEPAIEQIRKACMALFTFFRFDVYARIDGFYTSAGEVFLNDPNTTSGMLPGSFFFHQAAEIGLPPSRFLTYIIWQSLKDRLSQDPGNSGFKKALDILETRMESSKTEKAKKQRIGVLLGGYSSERHISVESGRNVFEKLSSSADFQPIPIFLTKENGELRLWKIPVNFLLKDNADDIAEKIQKHATHPFLEKLRAQAAPLRNRFAPEHEGFEPVSLAFEKLNTEVDAVFIALHGRPGEDGEIQQKLLAANVPFNGSQPDSSRITIDKYETLQILGKNGFIVTGQQLVEKKNWSQNREEVYHLLEEKFGYPLIAKPVDDGCSSAVRKINNRKDLEAWFSILFREEAEIPQNEAQTLGLKLKEDFPQKEVALIEELISAKDAAHFLEITGGMLTHYDAEGRVIYEVFEPSEALAGKGVLSLEEKFLAGEGQNITPARFGKNEKEYAIISAQVKETLEKAARLLGVEGYCRIDAFVRIYEDLRAEIIIIEVNSLPGMTPATCIFHQAAINGYKPFDFIHKILNFGIQRSTLTHA